ncbi:MAG: prepilin-type N-terminal cleavage/methylation domain-containing protein, partial [Bacilli bacterium]
MIKNLRKKGFTIVELVIVIAVIAILAAILIPTFSGIIKKANIASDTAMAKNMNTALVMADSEGNVPEDMGDVLFILYGAGY